jgi:hypothetical protein
MTLDPASFERIGRRQWLKFAAAVWLLLISVTTIVNSVGLSRIERQIQRNAVDAQLKVLRARMTHLEQQTDARSQQPMPLSQADFAAARQTLDDRMTRLDEAQRTSVTTTELHTLQARVSTLETQLRKTRQAASAARSPASAKTKPTVQVPPFRVLGVELRGGERFLSIIFTDATSLAGVRLLRVGDTDSGWQLKSIEAQVAVFDVDGQMQWVALP